jgi:hypothetical protein
MGGARLAVPCSGRASMPPAAAREMGLSPSESLGRSRIESDW